MRRMLAYSSAPPGAPRCTLLAIFSCYSSKRKTTIWMIETHLGLLSMLLCYHCLITRSYHTDTSIIFPTPTLKYPFLCFRVSLVSIFIWKAYVLGDRPRRQEGREERAGKPSPGCLQELVTSRSGRRRRDWDIRVLLSNRPSLSAAGASKSRVHIGYNPTLTHWNWLRYSKYELPVLFRTVILHNSCSPGR